MINEIKMQELKDMFFYTFGIVPLQNYNVVGDGITDNRLGIQQAIYDAIENKVKYIFVPKGNYYYSGQLFKTDEVILIGKKTTEYIYKGLLENGFDMKKVHVLNDVKDAFMLIKQLRENDTYVLLENDLPDLFSERS